MTSLSAILAEIEASAEKIKTLEADLAATKENSKSLVEQYRTQSADALKTLGIVAAEKTAKKKLNLTEVTADVKQKIEERAKGLSAS